MTSVQVPLASRPAKCRQRDSCGLNVLKKGALPNWIGVAALSSKIVLLKLAALAPLPTPLNKSGNRDLTGPAHIEVQRRREIGSRGGR